VTYDPRRRRILFSGGENDSTTFSDAWALELKNGAAAHWLELRSNPNAPTPRGARHAVYVPSHDRLVVFRGESLTARASSPDQSDHGFGDVWALSLSGRERWELLAPTGVPPTARAFGSAIYDPARARVVIFGGEDGLEKRNDTWSLNFTPPGVTADLALESPAIEPAPGASFALHGAAPNPAVGDWAISFSLPDAAPARLALITVAGRVLETRDVGSMGPGRHTLRIGPAHDLPAGIYFVRLSRGAQSLVTKLAMLR
jgi:hypothetical protein